MMGSIVSTLSLTKLQKYSLFQKYKARSATLRLDSVPTSCADHSNPTHLEMGTGHRLCQLVEQRLLNLRKLARVHHLEDVFDLIQKHDLLCAVHLGPVT